jgi:hypothetical protein
MTSRGLTAAIGEPLAADAGKAGIGGEAVQTSAITDYMSALP